MDSERIIDSVLTTVIVIQRKEVKVMHRLTVAQEIENCEEVLRAIDLKIERLQNHKKGLENKLATLKKKSTPAFPTNEAPYVPPVPPFTAAGAALLGKR